MNATVVSVPRIPNRIEPHPLIEAVAEVRFQPQTVGEAVFGMVYFLFQGEYPSLEKLPILQLPDEVRQSDPNLTFLPHYRLSGPRFTLQVGPRVISVSISQYAGWRDFSAQIFDVFRKLKTQPIFGVFDRISLRYINFFEGNVLDHSTVKVEFAGESVADRPIFIRTEINSPPYLTTLHIATKATVGTAPAARTGSAIDLDTFMLSPQLGEDGEKQFVKLLDGAHAELKTRFFSLLKPEYVATLNPEFD